MAKSEMTNQFKNLYQKMPFWQKLVIGGVVLAVVIGIIYIISSASSSVDMSLLYSGIEESEMSKIVGKLKESNVKYELRSGNTIYVEKDKLYETRIALASEGIPESGTVGYEIFDKTSLGMSEFVQKLNFRRALEGELVRTISTLDEVKKARVHLVIPERALFEKDQKTPSASVILHLKSNRTLNKSSVVGIQNLVASSIEGMNRDAVTVIDQQGKVLSDTPSDGSTIAGLTKTQYEEKISVEQYLANKVQGMLDGVLGPGNSEVRINTDLDFTQVEKTITDYDPEKQAVRSEQSITEKSQSTDSLSYPAVNMAKDQSNQISNYEVPKTVQKIVEGVGNIKRLSIAAMINGTNKIIDDNGKKTVQYTPRNDDEMKKLTEIIKNSVGYDPTRNDQFSITTIPFDTSNFTEDVQQLQEIPWWKNPDNVKLIILILTVLITMFIMYRLMQSKIIKDKMRIVMSLPEPTKAGEDMLIEEEPEDIMLDEDQLMFLPTELPEQLLLEGERQERPFSYDDGEDVDRDYLTSRARGQLEGERIDLSENDLMRLEIRGKVQQYMDDRTTDAIRLIRILLLQDPDERFKS